MPPPVRSPPLPAAPAALSASASSKRAKIWDEERGAADGVERGADAQEEGRAP